ncbi:hypothetical protein [Arthrobacter cupressi]|uniref:UDP-N-acetylglucosamine:LPS N-acetylglucosamine transferase n=1 Tax=Arthrobacter cupressi TaxID=1045773 RepID=A0A1G8UKI8_9MICC|nr:hypothetical protein [Arthrobacter cupressi]NYD76485.1 UDP:flavonoid glycosyltransferase YjiC (YdhE family) [Arthrobacter cupressi]SDJ54338.1 hypothetical protein SAMN05216555_11231 [Arthrobacter cupressi]
MKRLVPLMWVAGGACVLVHAGTAVFAFHAATQAGIVSLAVLSLLDLVVVISASGIVFRHLSRGVRATQMDVERARKDASRLNYHLNLKLDRIERTVNRVRALDEGISGGLTPVASHLRLPWQAGSALPRVLFVTSNGAGVGHLTRCMSIASAGQALFDSHFVSLSSAAKIVEGFGFSVLSFDSQTKSQLPAEIWNDRFAEFMDAVCRENKPAAVVFDGTWIYRGVHEAARRHGARVIWLRRGLWKNNASAVQIEDTKSYADHVIVPGDIAANHDRGPVANCADHVDVPAITFAPYKRQLSREEALDVLSLPHDRRYVLVQLGAGQINDTSTARRDVIEGVLSADLHTDVVLALSPLTVSTPNVGSRVHVVREFPISRLFAAFDCLIAAAGYNTVHEAIHSALPGFWIPNTSTSTDNQELRSSIVERSGLGAVAKESPRLAIQVEAFLSDVRSGKFTAHSHELEADHGAGAAKAIVEYLGTQTIPLHADDSNIQAPRCPSQCITGCPCTPYR